MSGSVLGWDLTIAVALVALAGSAFFSGCETGYMSVSRARLHRLGALAEPRGRRLAVQLAHIEDSILTCLIGTNLFNVLGSAVVTYALSSRYGPRGEWLALLIVATFVIVGGEILPKVVYREHPERMMLASVPLATGARTALAPVRWLLRGYTALLGLVLPPPSAGVEGDRRSLAALMLSNAVPAADDRRFADLLDRFVRLAGRSVSGLARPLDQVISVPAFAPVREFLAVAAESGHSRLPVRDGDAVTAYVLARDLLLLPEDQRERILPRRLWRPLLMVDGRLSPYAMFEEMRGQERQIALVCDPDGNPQGLVTLEDLIEAVVGAIADEFDPPDAAVA
ncbi:MAG: DUF21 domain-containing protein [bacterium]|nr:DUF21 domain-containing protein [bacterium]